MSTEKQQNSSKTEAAKTTHATASDLEALATRLKSVAESLVEHAQAMRDDGVAKLWISLDDANSKAERLEAFLRRLGTRRETLKNAVMEKVNIYTSERKARRNKKR